VARTRVVIDTDPGVDDAVAILLALASPEIEVLALTTVAGNVSLDKTTLNARRLLQLARRGDVTVAAGCSQPLAGPSGDASEVHGNDGLSDLEWDEPEVPLSERHAVDVLAGLIDDGPLTIVAIGPLTNLATLLERHGGVEGRVERVVLMGGASFEGNVTPAAEFNIWAGPFGRLAGDGDAARPDAPGLSQRRRRALSEGPRQRGGSPVGGHIGAAGQVPRRVARQSKPLHARLDGRVRGD
jgi:inosine-uridine nucleoside N-ribohydrolase